MHMQILCLNESYKTRLLHAAPTFRTVASSVQPMGMYIGHTLIIKLPGVVLCEYDALWQLHLVSCLAARFARDAWNDFRLLIALY
jgi:hypothetical protein